MTKLHSTTKKNVYNILFTKNSDPEMYNSHCYSYIKYILYQPKLKENNMK